MDFGEFLTMVPIWVLVHPRRWERGKEETTIF
jgi:hypothetical protein